MKAGGIESIRWPLGWAGVQPTAKGGYDWAGFDEVVAVAARQGLTVLPFFYGTPRWLARKETKLPIDSGRARKAWTAFLAAAVKRYGPGGEFWAERAPGTVQYAPAIPRRSRSAPGRSGTRPTSSTSPSPPRRSATRSWCRSPARRSNGSTPAPKSSSAASSANRPRTAPRACRRPSSSRSSTARRGSRAASTASPCTPTRSTRKRWKNWSRGCTKSRSKTTTACRSTSPRWAGDPRTTSTRSPSSRGPGPGQAAAGLLRLPAGEPQPARPQAGLLVLLEGPARLLQLLRLGRLLPRRPQVPPQARLARLRGADRRPRAAVGGAAAISARPAA